jgi:hypothetical protein
MHPGPSVDASGSSLRLSPRLSFELQSRHADIYVRHDRGGQHTMECKSGTASNESFLCGLFRIAMLPVLRPRAYKLISYACPCKQHCLSSSGTKGNCSKHELVLIMVPLAWIRSGCCLLGPLHISPGIYGAPH